MERAIGSMFEYNGVKLTVERAKEILSCDGCFFAHSRHSCLGEISHVGKCNPFSRIDKQSVVFVKVEDDKNKEG